MAALRKGRKSDAPHMCELDALCFEPDTCYERAFFDFLLRRADTFSLVAEDEAGNMIGFAIWQIVPARVPYGHIVTIDVHPDHRRNGAGSTLIEAVHKQTRDKGVERIALEVNAGNKDALRFYHFHKYQAVTEIADYYGPGQNGFLMIKKINL